MPPSTHSTHGASGAHRWMTCPGSIRMSEGIPETSSVYADEGTKAHEIAEQLLRSKGVQTDAFDDVDAEMMEAVDLYVKTVRLDKTMLGGKIFIEQTFDLSSIRPGMFGTGDAVLLTKDTLIVYDFKYGAGVPVEAAGNPQLKYYALGALLHHMSKRSQIKTIEAVIVQPRCRHADGPVRRVTYDPIDLLEFRAELAEAYDQTQEPDAPLVAGDHCRWCPAKAQCPALLQHTQALAKIEFASVADPTPPDPRLLTPEELAAVLEKADVVEDWIRAVRARTQDMLAGGAQVPGFKLVEKRPQRVWTDPDLAAEALQNVFGLSPDEVYTRKLVSPAQAEKTLTKEQREQLSELWVKRSSGPTLARESDKRPALPPSAVSDFAEFLPSKTETE